MLMWIWDYGDERQAACSLPPLDHRRLDALVRQAKNDYGDDDHFYFSMRSFWLFLTEKDMSEAVLALLHAFQWFEPRLYRDESSPVHEETDPERWHIRFRVRKTVIDWYIPKLIYYVVLPVSRSSCVFWSS